MVKGYVEGTVQKLTIRMRELPESMQKAFGVRSVFFYVEVTTARLNKITELFDRGKLVGTVLPLEDQGCP